MELRRGMLVKSKAGRDKDCIYVIGDVKNEYVYLADGKIRPLERPKKKKLMHVQIDYQQTEISSDLEIRKVLKAKEV